MTPPIIQTPIARLEDALAEIKAKEEDLIKQLTAERKLAMPRWTAIGEVVEESIGPIENTEDFSDWLQYWYDHDPAHPVFASGDPGSWDVVAQIANEFEGSDISVDAISEGEASNEESPEEDFLGADKAPENDEIPKGDGDESEPLPGIEITDDADYSLDVSEAAEDEFNGEDDTDDEEIARLTAAMAAAANEDSGQLHQSKVARAQLEADILATDAEQSSKAAVANNIYLKDTSFVPEETMVVETNEKIAEDTAAENIAVKEEAPELGAYSTTNEPISLTQTEEVPTFNPGQNTEPEFSFTAAEEKATEDPIATETEAPDIEAKLDEDTATATVDGVLDYIKNMGFSAEQIAELIAAVKDGLSFKDIKVMCNPEFGVKEMKDLRGMLKG